MRKAPSIMKTKVRDEKHRFTRRYPRYFDFLDEKSKIRSIAENAVL